VTSSSAARRYDRSSLKVHQSVTVHYSRSDVLSTKAWNYFRHSAGWRGLRRVRVLRSALYFAIAMRECWVERSRTHVDAVDRDFLQRLDPFSYLTNPLERERFKAQQWLLDGVRRGQRFTHGLEIGSAEGAFTEIVASTCDSLLVADLSPTALVRTRQKCASITNVQYIQWDLLSDPVPGLFDLIVVAGVLEYFTRRATFAKTREKLMASLTPDGYLLVESTRQTPIVEDSWWGRYLIRGKRINDFFEQHEEVGCVWSVVTRQYAISVIRKRGPSDAGR
jgi:2-polyprenyl-3-methyl-5-hydroxy-6-metoxy-1,4-benzoquinol methylase